jgi:hypothetical protein
MSNTKTNQSISPAELYKLTLSREGHTMSELMTKTVRVDAWAVTETVDSNGEFKPRCGIIVDGVPYITNGRAFSERLLAIVDYLGTAGMEDVGFKMQITQIRSKNNRNYTSCELIFD